MDTITTVSTATIAPILAIDLGKYKSVACLYKSATAEVQFVRFTTCPTELLRLIGRHRPGRRVPPPNCGRTVGARTRELDFWDATILTAPLCPQPRKGWSPSRDRDAWDWTAAR